MKKREQQLQRKATLGNAAGELIPAVVHDVLRSSGQALDAATRASMERRFGHDFGSVRVHADEEAANSAQALGALAYTVGRHVVFGAGQYAPRSNGGRRLLAHELTHVVQQSHGAVAIQRSPGPPWRKKETTIRVRWRTDSPTGTEPDLEETILQAIADSRAFEDVPVEEIPSGLMYPVKALIDSEEGRRKKHRDGRIHVSAMFNRHGDKEWDDVKVTFADAKLPAATAPAQPTTPAFPPMAPPDRPKTALDKDRAIMQKLYAEMAEDTDREGYSAFDIVIANNGKELDPISMAKVGRKLSRSAGSDLLTKQEAYRQIEWFMDVVVSHPGTYKARYTRYRPGAMSFNGFERIQDAPPTPQPHIPPKPPRVRTAAEEFEEATGTVYPPRINKALQEIAIQGLHEANPFLLKNLPYTIGGIIIPMGAMKLLTTDIQMGSIIRIEWAINEDIVEASETLETSAAGKQPAATSALRDLKPGDIIDTPQGPQRVVSVQPRKIITEPTPAAEPAPTGAGATPSAPPPTGAAPAENRIWIRLADGTITDFAPAEVQGTIKPGQSAKTPKGPGRVVRVGGTAPPQVTQKPFRALTPEELNKPVPLRKGLTGKPRRLERDELDNANKIQNVLERLHNGDETALAEANRFRAQPLRGEYAGWTEIDLRPDNPGPFNVMRLIVKVDKDGTMILRLLQMH